MYNYRYNMTCTARIGFQFAQKYLFYFGFALGNPPLWQSLHSIRAKYTWDHQRFFLFPPPSQMINDGFAPEERRGGEERRKLSCCRKSNEGWKLGNELEEYTGKNYVWSLCGHSVTQNDCVTHLLTVVLRCCC